jgi:ATP-dependent DNA ligase
VHDDHKWSIKSRPRELFQIAGVWRGDELPAGGMVAELKIDGWRCGHFRGIDGRAGLWTRNGFPIEGTGHILHAISIMEAVAGEPLFIDGEFQVAGTLDATKRWCESGWKAGGEAGTFYAFDCLAQAEWESNDCERPWVERKAMLEKLYRESLHHPLSWEYRPRSYGRKPDAPIVEIIDDAWCFDARDVRNEANRVWARGGEGLILKQADAPYRRNKSSDWQKVKHPGYVPGMGVQWK